MNRRQALAGMLAWPFAAKAKLTDVLIDGISGVLPVKPMTLAGIGHKRVPMESIFTAMFREFAEIDARRQGYGRESLIIALRAPAERLARCIAMVPDAGSPKASDATGSVAAITAEPAFSSRGGACHPSDGAAPTAAEATP